MNLTEKNKEDKVKLVALKKKSEDIKQLSKTVDELAKKLGVDKQLYFLHLY